MPECRAENPSFRRRVYEVLNLNVRGDRTAMLVTAFIVTLISLNVLAVVLESIPELMAVYGPFFQAFDVFSVAIFTVEYGLRIWSSVEDPRYSEGRFPRLRFMISPMAMVDLFSILPFFLSLFIPIDLRFMRAIRLIRVFKLTRYSNAMSMLGDVFREEAGTLIAAFFILAILLIIAASGAYLVEHKAQPDEFGTIPQSMWWALVTLTTVGYGDVVPATTLGRIFGGIITIVGVLMAAIPTGLLASRVAEHTRQRRDDLRYKYESALRDGIVDAQEEEELETLRRRLGLSRDVARRIREEVRVSRQRSEKSCTCPNCGHQFET